LILLAAALAASSSSSAPLRIATYAYPAYDRRLALASLARLIAEETGRLTEIVLVSSPNDLAAALRARRADIAMTNLASFISASGDQAVRPIAALAVPSATLDGYRGVLLARREAKVQTLRDVAAATGRLRYVEVLPGSTSGAMVQAEALSRAGGARRRFAIVDQAGTHDAALQRLLTGRSDVAALAEGPWRELRRSNPDGAQAVHEIWRSSPIPPGPVVCVHVSSVPCTQIAKRLLRDDPGSQTAAADLAKGWSETAGATSFIRVQPNAYRAFTGPHRR
jgi:ABC-type phosphate/phosphonate transport system substrate-binding protein